MTDNKVFLVKVDSENKSMWLLEKMGKAKEITPEELEQIKEGLVGGNDIFLTQKQFTALLKKLESI